MNDNYQNREADLANARINAKRHIRLAWTQDIVLIIIGSALAISGFYPESALFAGILMVFGIVIVITAESFIKDIPDFKELEQALNEQKNKLQKAGKLLQNNHPYILYLRSFAVDSTEYTYDYIPRVGPVPRKVDSNPSLADELKRLNILPIVALGNYKAMRGIVSSAENIWPKQESWQTDFGAFASKAALIALELGPINKGVEYELNWIRKVDYCSAARSTFQNYKAISRIAWQSSMVHGS